MMFLYTCKRSLLEVVVHPEGTNIYFCLQMCFYSFTVMEHQAACQEKKMFSLCAYYDKVQLWAILLDHNYRLDTFFLKCAKDLGAFLENYVKYQ